MVLLFCLFVLFATSNAAKVYWANWQATPVVENGVTKYIGKINVPDQNNKITEVTIKYSSNKAINFIQSGTGIDYWKSGSANSPYTSAAVDNDPPASSTVSLKFASTNTFEFSQPLGNVFVSYISINGNTFAFDRDFKILSNGPGYWGTGTVVHNVVGNTYQLQTTGGEPHGTVGLDGKFDKFSFDALRDENWFGFTIGTYGLSSVVYPEPASPYCVDYLSLVPKDPETCCPQPTLYCVKLLNAIPQTGQGEVTCLTQNEGSAAFVLNEEGQRVWLSSDADGTISAGFDELGILTVTTPSGVKTGKNYIAWEADCADPAFPSQQIATSPTDGADEITDLFNNEVGTFHVNLKLKNKYAPYSNEDAWICTGSSLIPPPPPSGGYPTYNLNDESTLMASNEGGVGGLSASMTILVSVLSALGTTLLVVGIMAFAGYTVVKKGNNFLPNLQEGLRE